MEPRRPPLHRPVHARPRPGAAAAVHPPERFHTSLPRSCWSRVGKEGCTSPTPLSCERTRPRAFSPGPSCSPARRPRRRSRRRSASRCATSTCPPPRRAAMLRAGRPVARRRPRRHAAVHGLQASSPRSRGRRRRSVLAESFDDFARPRQAFQQQAHGVLRSSRSSRRRRRRRRLSMSGIATDPPSRQHRWSDQAHGAAGRSAQPVPAAGVVEGLRRLRSKLREHVAPGSTLTSLICSGAW